MTGWGRTDGAGGNDSPFRHCEARSAVAIQNMSINQRLMDRHVPPRRKLLAAKGLAPRDDGVLQTVPSAFSLFGGFQTCEFEAAAP
jgi:hypothetical protein